MAAVEKIDDALVAKLAELPEAIAGLKRQLSELDERTKKATTETERKAADAFLTAEAAKAKADEIRAKMSDATFGLPGAEELVKRGKLSVGHFIAARALVEMDHGNEKRARELFPVVFDVHNECEKRLSEAGRERALGMRTQVTHDDTLGGFLVPEEISGQVVPYAYPATCLSKLNIVTVTPRGKPYRVLKMTGSGTVYMSGETPANSSAAKSTVSFGRANLSPKKAIAIGAVSREVDDLSNPSVLAMLEADFRTKIALKMEQQVVEGLGGSYEVRGLDKYTAAADGINTFDATGTDSSSVTAQANGRDLTDYFMRRLGHVVEAQNALAGGGKMQYLMPTKLKQVLSLQQQYFFSGQKPDTGAAPIFQLGIIDDARLEAAYGPIAHSTQFSTTRTIGGSSDGGLVVAGEFRNCVLPMWGGLLVARDDGGVLSNSSGVVTLNAFQEEAMLVRVTSSFDFAAVRPSDLVLATGFRSVRSGV